MEEETTTNSSLFVAIYALLSGVAPLCSALFPLLLSSRGGSGFSPRTTYILLGFSAGLLFAIATLDLIPTAVQMESSSSSSSSHHHQEEEGASSHAHFHTNQDVSEKEMSEDHHHDHSSLSMVLFSLFFFFFSLFCSFFFSFFLILISLLVEFLGWCWSWLLLSSFCRTTNGFDRPWPFSRDCQKR